MNNCIYCRMQNLDPSAEHVVADSLGGSIELNQEDVCKPCNNRIDQQIDRAVQTDLEPILAQLEIPGKRGKTTRWVSTEMIDGKERKFLVGKDEIVAAEPRKLLNRQGDTYYFRATSRAQLEQARDEIAARNPGRTVQLSDITERIPTLPESRVDEVDFTAPHWIRWAAKTCLNVLCYVLGRGVVLRPEFDDLRSVALTGGSCPTDLHVGGVGENDVVDKLPCEHRISVCMVSGEMIVEVILFDYCGFQLRRKVHMADMRRTIVLDAANKRVIQDNS